VAKRVKAASRGIPLAAALQDAAAGAHFFWSAVASEARHRFQAQGNRAKTEKESEILMRLPCVPMAVHPREGDGAQPATANGQLPTAHCAGAHRRAGFTLVEMLTVIAIISILIGVTGISLIKARELSRRTRADAELREMVSAWLQYQQLYEEWPAVVKGKIEIPVSGAVLDPLINPESDDNPRGIVLLNVKLSGDAATFNDPWGTPYELSFDRDTASIPTITALRTSVTFPNRQRRFP
jgi:prepilin-type N-terminal cleavage/methylation domain-containing protein